MIECILTLDYEIYGDGTGSLKQLVYRPAERFRETCENFKARFVVFADVAELEMIEAYGADPAIGAVREQVRQFYENGFEVGLHIHPWWYNATWVSGQWRLDSNEYNLCLLAEERIAEIIDRALTYLRGVLGEPGFTPLCFRAGHLLFQPTQPAARLLAIRGVRVDSSVYKGGRWRQQQMDYRRALENGYLWGFADRADVPDTAGPLLECPIYTEMVPAWRIVTAKRLGLQRKAASAAGGRGRILSRLRDALRRQPLKLDFCQMSIRELTRMFDRVVREDEQDPASFRPVVAIGHTKDLTDFDTVEAFLAYLDRRGIAVSTFEAVYRRWQAEAAGYPAVA
jgi:hypothetical protein